jgi:hypothetical protein
MEKNFNKKNALVELVVIAGQAREALEEEHGVLAVVAESGEVVGDGGIPGANSGLL